MSVLSAAQLALPDHLFHDLMQPMATCDMFSVMGQSAGVDHVVEQLLLERIRIKCANEPSSHLAEIHDMLEGCEKKTLEAVQMTVAFISTRVRTATIAQQCVSARCQIATTSARNSATLILPAPRDMHAQLPARWPFTDAAEHLAGPGMLHHIQCERPRMMNGHQPLSIPAFGLPVDEVMLIRVPTWMTNSSYENRLEKVYAAALARARSRQTRELWIGVLDDKADADVGVAAKSIAEALVDYILLEMYLRVHPHQLSPLPHDSISILLGPCVTKTDIDVALHAALESLLTLNADATTTAAMDLEDNGASTQKTLWLQRADGANVTRIDMVQCALNGANVLRYMMDISLSLFSFSSGGEQGAEGAATEGGGAEGERATLKLTCTTDEAVHAVAALLSVGGGVDAQRGAVDQWVATTPPKDDFDCTFYQVLKAVDMLDAPVLQNQLMHHLRCHIVNHAAT